MKHIEKEKVSILLKNLNKCFNQLTFILEQDVLKLSQYENTIAVMELGVTTRDEIYKIQPKLEIMKKDVSYRDQLIELSKLYKVDEIKAYLKSKKNLTVSQIEVILIKNKRNIY